MTRDRNQKRLSGRLAVTVILTLAGCSGSAPSPTAEPLTSFDLSNDPSRQLEILSERIAASGNDFDALVRRAELLFALERFEEAGDAWEELISRRPKRKIRRGAVIGRAISYEAACGQLRVLDKSDLRGHRLSESSLHAWKFYAKSIDERPGALGEIRALYRMGRIEEAIKRLTPFQHRSQSLSEEHCLALLIQEQLGANPLSVIRDLDQFARSPEPDARELAVSQLIRLSETDDELEVAHTAEGLLVRLSREPLHQCKTLARWKSERSRTKDDRLADAHRKRAINESRLSLDRGLTLQAWRSLEPLVRGNGEGSPELVDLVNRCCTQLSDLCQEKLEIGDFETADRVATEIRSLPQSWLGESELVSSQNSLRAHQIATIRVQATGTLEKARAAVHDRRAADALRMLEPLLDEFPVELIPEVQMIRARALSQRGESEEALSLLERYGPFTEPMVQRLHASLLADVGRGEEAEAILESLPLKYFNVEAFDALLIALETQAKWEKLIARLNTLGEAIPQRYRPIRLRAVVGAAKRKIDNRNPQGAIQLLEGSLEDEEILTGGAGPLLIQALLETENVDGALDILTDDKHSFETMPTNLIRLVEKQAGSRLNSEQRFQLLRRLPEWERDRSATEFLASNWPRFGEYLPDPGSYEAILQIRRFGDEGAVLSDLTRRTRIEWKNAYFIVESRGDETETWRIEGDIWIRTTGKYEAWIPIRAEESPPLESIESPDGVSAQVVEAGHTITTRYRKFHGCLGIELSLPTLGPDEKIRIDLAPEIGEVMVRKYEGHRVIEQTDLLDWTSIRN